MKTKFFLAAILLLFAATNLLAYDFEYEGLYYNITNNTTKEVGVTYESYTSYPRIEYGWYIRNAVILDKVMHNGETYSVTSIGNKAFSGCSSLTSVTIPNSVTSIGSSAFSGCSGLTSVTIPNSVTSISSSAFEDCSSLTSVTIPNSVTSIGSSAFRGCSGLTSVTIPNSVTSIGDDAFSGCSGLTSVTIPNSVTSIGDDAFSKCSSLTSVTIPNSVTSIGSYAFSKCSSLTSVTIPNSVTSIGNSAFSSCSGLTSVTIPNSVTSIGSSAFSGCSGLTSVTIGNSVTSIGSSAFSGCSGLTSVTLNSNAIVGKTYTSSSKISSIFGSQVKKYDIGEDVKSIGDYAFYDCSGLTSVTIPNSVTSIGESAFSGCSGLTSVTIPNSVTSISSSAFSGCSSLTSVTIPNSVTSIGSYAFSNCSGLTSVTIPNSVTSIGESAFSGCSGLTSVTIPNSVTSIGSSAFSGCSGLISVTIPKSVTSIGSSAFSGCSGLTSVYCEPSTPPTFGSGAFSSTTTPIYVADCALTAYQAAPGWKDLTIVPVAFNLLVVNNIGGSVINRCGEGLVEALAYDGYHFVRWQDGNTDNPRAYALTDAKHNYIAQFAINRHTLSLQGYAEHGYITGDNGTFDYGTAHTIEAHAYYGYHFVEWSDGVSDNPRTIILTQDTVLKAEFAIDRSGTCGDDNKLTWTYDPETATLTISGDGTLNSNYTYGAEAPVAMQNLIFEGGVQSIGVEAFKNFGTIQTLTIGADVKTIGSNAFRGCSSLTSVQIPAAVNNIAPTAFANCSGLQSITVDGANSTYDSRDNSNAIIKTSSKILVLGCKTTTIPVTVNSIGESAFADCKALTAINIPENVRSIGKSAFSGCSELTTVKIPASMAGIGENAFRGCSGMTSLTCNAVLPPILGASVFEEVDKTIPLNVPVESIELYKEADQWKDFVNIIDNLISVVFLDWDGTLLAKREVEEGEAAIAPADPMREGYTFTSWSKDFSNITEQIYVIAIYEKDITGTLPVYFVDSEGNNILTSYVADPTPVAPVVENYTFVDWIIEEASVAGGITIRATYTEGVATGQEDITEPQDKSEAPQKIMRNGHVYILMPDGRRYSVTGQEVR